MPVIDPRTLVGGVHFENEPPAPEMSDAFVGVELPKACFVNIGGPQKQADAGSCLPHAYTAAIEAWARKVEPIDLQLSRQDAYFTARQEEGNGAETRDGGCYPSIARAAYAHRGFLPESRKKYVPADVTTWRRPAEWEAQGALLKSGFDAIPRTVAAAKALLADGFALPVCHLVYENMVDLPIDGIERPPVGSILGGHCRLLTGYDDARGMFEVMNWWSWGLPRQSEPERHRDGFSWVPYELYENTQAWIKDAAWLALPPEGIEA